MLLNICHYGGVTVAFLNLEQARDKNNKMRDIHKFLLILGFINFVNLFIKGPIEAEK